jgi:glutaredoxin
MLGRIFKIFSLFIIFFSFTASVFAEDLTIHFFEQRGCPDCARQKEFFDEIIDEYPDVEIKSYYITDREGVEKLHELAQERGIEDYRIMVPTTFIGDNFFQGFRDSDKDLIIEAIEGGDVERETGLINIPFFGEVNVRGWSLPFLAFVIGSLDGLNVCSIGALVLILMIVLTLDSRRKILFYGGLFILTAVLIYGVLVFAWTAVIDALVGHLDILGIFIGLAALAGSVYFFREFLRFRKYGPTCSSGGGKLISSATRRVQEAFKDKKKGALFLAGSVIIFAAVITLVELPCSIALPVVFAGILAESGLSSVGYISYILLYLFAYMLIEIIIFIGAVITKEVWFAQSKAITWVYFFGSLLLVFLAFYYLIWLNL